MLRKSNGNRLTDSDWLLIAICAAVVIASVGIVVRYFDEAFPQAAVEFRFDRNASRPVAEAFLEKHGLKTAEMKHAVRFDSDTNARIFLERTLGLEETNALTAGQVHVWAWHHRWYTPLVEEELSVDVAPDGQIVGFTRRIPEAKAMRASRAEPPVDFLRSIGVNVADLNLVEQSERRLPNRVQRIFTWESASIKPAGAPYRHLVTVDGDEVTSYAQRLEVPEAWERSYRELRSKNAAAGSIDLLFNALLMIAATIVFIVRLRRGDLSFRFLLGIGIAAVLIVGAAALNAMPSELAYYDTTTSYGAFLAGITFQSIVSSLGTAMLLIVICGSGEILYRERLPNQLAMPRVWSFAALRSKRVFLALILGYALVPLFMAYQVVFYIVSHKYGAWAPAEVPYDDIMNSAIPWAAVLLAGFFPAFSEEFLSRAFAIPFIQRYARSRMVAIVVAAFIWGFGHAAYPNQPFWIRGVEVGLAGIVAGLLMDRFGLLPLLIWHYTIDAVYTATLLFSSGNPYYIASAAAASLLFAMPLVVSLALYIRHRSFAPDEGLLNASIPVAPEPERVAPGPPDPLPAGEPLRRKLILFTVIAVAFAAAAIVMRPPSVDEAANFAIDADRAKEIARAHIATLAPRAAQRGFTRVIAAPGDGFRAWNRESSREDGGSPAGGFDSLAATWLMRQGMTTGELTTVLERQIEAPTWTVRFFTPLQKEEIFVSVSDDGARVVGFHRLVEEAAPGAQLPQALASRIATSAFPVYGLDPSNFELKEALSFQQPRRRDWLFHFDEKGPLDDAAPQARRRITVRVTGAALTQFEKTIRIPDEVYRQLTTQTLVNVLLFVLKLAGLVALFAAVIAGLVTASRHGGLPWRRPLRITLALAIIPVVAFAARSELMLFRYSTNIAWDTFRVGLLTSFVRDVGLQLGLLFLALAGIEAVLPFAPRLLRRDGRGRFGRAAVLRALSAIAIAVLALVGLAWIRHALPSMATIDFSATDLVALPLPALVIAGRALIAAATVSGAILLYRIAIPQWRARITMTALFCALLDPAATPGELPLMLATALGGAILFWLISSRILGENPLAWPLAIFTISCASGAVVLLQNERFDLFANGIALVLVPLAAAAFLWRSDARIS